MKVCMLTHTYPRFPEDVNGPFIEALAETLQDLGAEVTVLTPYDVCFNRTSKDHDVELRTYKYVYPRRFHLLGYSRTIEADIRLKKKVFFLAPLMFVSAFASLLKLTKENKYDILHAHWFLPNGFIAALVSKICRVPLIITLHGSDVFIAERNILFKNLAKVAFTQSDQITSCSPDLKDRLVKLGADARKIKLIPYATNPTLFERKDNNAVAQIKTKLGIKKNQQVILALGRLVYKKGFEYLLQAAPSILQGIRNVKFVIAGDGDLREELKEQALKLGIRDVVIFPGTIYRDDIPNYFQMCDIFVMPSIRDHMGNVDGLPNVILEAMAAEKPVVATNVGGISLAIKDNVNGIIVEEKNPTELAEAILRLLKSQQLRSKLAKAARKEIVESLNWENISKKFLEIYAEAT